MSLQEQVSPRFVRAIERSLNLLENEAASVSDTEIKKFKEQHHRLLLRTLKMGGQLAQTQEQTTTLLFLLFPYAAYYQLYVEWISFTKQIVDQSGSVSPLMAAHLLHNIGQLLNQNHQGKEALKYLEEAAHIVEEANIDDSGLIASINSALSISYQQIGNLNQAIELSKRSISLIQGAETPTDAHIIFNNSAINFHMKGDFEAAEQQFDRAIEKMNAHFKPSFAARILYNQANLFGDMSKFDQALRQIAKAEELLAKSNNLVDQISLQINKGGLEFRRGNWANAEKAFLEAQKMLLAHRGLLYLSAIVEVSLGNVWLKLESYRKAEQAVKRSVQLWANISPTPSAYSEINLANATGTLGEVYKARGLYDEAKYHLHEALAILEAYPAYAMAQRLTTSFQKELELIDQDMSY